MFSYFASDLCGMLRLRRAPCGEKRIRCHCVYEKPTYTLVISATLASPSFAFYYCTAHLSGLILNHDPSFALLFVNHNPPIPFSLLLLLRININLARCFYHDAFHEDKMRNFHWQSRIHLNLAVYLAMNLQPTGLKFTSFAYMWSPPAFLISPQSVCGAATPNSKRHHGNYGKIKHSKNWARQLQEKFNEPHWLRNAPHRIISALDHQMWWSPMH